MNDSNQTLRFSRTSRDEYGYALSPEDFADKGDNWVGLLAVFAWGFLFGMIVGGVV